MDHEELSALYRKDPEKFEVRRAFDVSRAIESAPHEMRSRLWAIQEAWDKRMKNVPEKDRLKTAKSVFVDMLQGVLCPLLR